MFYYAPCTCVNHTCWCRPGNGFPRRGGGYDRVRRAACRMEAGGWLRYPASGSARATPMDAADIRCTVSGEALQQGPVIPALLASLLEAAPATRHKGYTNSARSGCCRHSRQSGMAAGRRSALLWLCAQPYGIAHGRSISMCLHGAAADRRLRMMRPSVYNSPAPFHAPDRDGTTIPRCAYRAAYTAFSRAWIMKRRFVARACDTSVQALVARSRGHPSLAYRCVQGAMLLAYRQYLGPTPPETMAFAAHVFDSRAIGGAPTDRRCWPRSIPRCRCGNGCGIRSRWGQPPATCWSGYTLMASVCVRQS